jgi:hypothetical protein
MTTIAGRQVQLNDELWYNALGLWAQVTAPGVITVNGINGQLVKYAFTEGGKINGRKQLSWHQPLVFDAPVRDITRYQALLDTAHNLFKD